MTQLQAANSQLQQLALSENYLEHRPLPIALSLQKKKVPSGFEPVHAFGTAWKTPSDST